MAEHNTETQVASTEVAHKEIGFMSPEINLLILTWVTFISVLIILHKFAWKPILANIKDREESIRKSVEEADKIKAELAKIEQSRKEVLDEAAQKSRDLIEQSRKAAIEAAKIINQKAQEESRILLENAVREIKDEKGRALAELKETSANIAITLAGRLIEENLDEEKNRKLINQMIKEI